MNPRLTCLLTGGLVVLLGLWALPTQAAPKLDDLRTWLKETNRRTYLFQGATRKGNNVEFRVRVEDLYIDDEIEKQYKRDHPDYDPKQEPYALEGYEPGYTRPVLGAPTTLVLPVQARVVLYDYPGHIAEPWVTNAGFLARIMTEGIPSKDLVSTREAMAKLSGVRPDPKEIEIPWKYPGYSYVLRRNGTRFRELIQIYQP